MSLLGRRSRALSSSLSRGGSRGRSPRARGLLCAGLALAALTLSACGKQIGDKCRTALDCSVSASRLCDRTEPGGYCTVQDCDLGTCPSEAVCVKFRPAVNRLSVTYCMYKCGDTDDCRTDQGYRCLHANEFGVAGEAEIVGNPNTKFCAVRDTAPAPQSIADDGGTADTNSSSTDANLSSSDADLQSGG
ncbi:MAG TPA: hypothetical protein VF331_13640 [Polyangiales bacterium]